MPSRASRLASALACVALGCQVGACANEREGLPDEELGNLVVSPHEEEPTVDPAKAKSSVNELMAILHLPHSWVSSKLGAHKVSGHYTLEVREGKEVVEELEEKLTMSYDSKGRYWAELDNSKEYGRHAIYDGTSLYLRPRYGRYHGRAPNDQAEESKIRNELFAFASDYLDLAARRLEVSDKGSGTLQSRSVQELQLQLAPDARKVAAETLPQRLWRNDAEVLALEGLAKLDIETGVPLSLAFKTTVAFERDGRRFEMSIDAERNISALGHGESVSAPPDDQIVRIAPRQRELSERDQLLKSIAPPAPSAPTPQDPTGRGAN
jgi:hypothetical protein